MNILLAFALVVVQAANAPAKHAPRPATPAAPNAAPAKQAPPHPAKPATTDAASAEQNPMGAYKSMRMDEVGLFVGNFDGTIDRMSDGVKIALLSDDPEKKPLPIQAREMKFTWTKEGDSKRPSRILLEGNVVVSQEDMNVHSEHADWEFDKGILTFTGKPVITTPQYPEGVNGEKVVLNFNDSQFKIFGGTSKEIPLGAVSGPDTPASPGGGPSFQLHEQDILDWPGFVNKIKSQSAAAEPSPGKRVHGLLDIKVQKMIASVPVETLLTDKQAILKQINRVLTNPKMFDKGSWNGVQLDADAQGLLSQANLDPRDAVRLNRALIEAAFPGLIAPAPKPAPTN